MFDACSPLWERPRERFGQNNYEYHDDMMSWTPPTTVPWLCKMMVVKRHDHRKMIIKGPDNPTWQLLPRMSTKCCSGDGEERKDKGGGGGSRSTKKVVCVCDKVVWERWCGERWWVTKWCVKDGVVKDGV